MGGAFINPGGYPGVPPPPLYKTLTLLLLTNSLFPSPPSQELRGEVSDRAGRVKELEVELLTASQRLAAGASDHAQQMTEQATQLDKCKVRWHEASLLYLPLQRGAPGQSEAL